MKKNLPVLLIIFFLFSCNKDKVKDEQSFSKLDMPLKEIIEIDINDSTINTNHLNFYNDEEDIFIYSTEVFDNFYETFFYSLEDSVENFTIKFLIEGENAVGKLVLPILVESKKSFYALNTKSELLHLNNEGVVIDKRTIILPDSINRVKTTEFSKLEKKGNKFYMETIPIDRENYYNRYLSIIYDYDNNSIEYIHSQYPDFMRKGESFGISSWNFSRTLGFKNNIFYSFNYDDQLYVYDKTVLVKKIKTGINELVDLPKSPVRDDSPADVQIDYFLKRAQFLELYFDNVSGNIVRIVHNGIEDEKLDTHRNWWDKELFIQLFDKNYNYLGYKQFEAKKFSSASFYYNDNLLYMPYHNKSNDDTKEDKFIIYVYKINI